jgi:hypothetical protein
MNPSGRIQLKKFPTMIGIAWLLGLVVAYGLFQLGSGTSADGLSIFFSHLQNVLAVILTMTLAAAAGYCLCAKDMEEALAGLVAPLLGLAVISTLFLLIGLLGWFPPRWGAWLILLLLNALLFRRVLRWLAWVRARWDDFWQPVDSGWLRAGRIFIVVAMVLALLMALAPPTQWDSLMYHLSAGQFYLQEGRIITSYDNVRFSNPNFVIMLFAWLQLIAQAQSAGLLMWVFGLLMIAAIAVFSARVAKEKSTDLLLLCSVIVVSMNGVWLSFTRAYSDAVVIVLFLTGLILLMEWGATRQNRLLIYAGVCAGLLVATKYTAFPFPMGFALAAVLIARREKQPWLPALTRLVLVAFLVFFPWLIKNWLVDGNPLAPYIWGSPASDMFDQLRQQSTSVGHWLVNWLLLPLQASIFGKEGLSPFQGGIGPFLFGAVPLVLLGWNKIKGDVRGIILLLFLSVTPAFLVWTVGSYFSDNLSIVRFYYGMSVVLALGIGMWLLHLPVIETGFPVRKIITAALVVATIISGSLVLYEYVLVNPLAVVLGRESTDAFLERRLGGMYVMSQEIQQLAEQDDSTRVIMLWEPRVFYCAPYCIGDDNLNHWQQALLYAGSGDAVVDEWIDDGITHVLSYDTGADFLVNNELQNTPKLTENEYDQFREVLPSRLNLLLSSDGYLLYAIVGNTK